MRRLEYIIIFLLSFLILALSFYPIYSRYKTTPPDRVYVGTTYYTADYAGYVSTIEQGIKGRWTYTDKFTTEKIPDTFLYYPYLIIGHLVGVFGINSIWAYHLSRLLLGLVYLLSIYWLIRVVFPSSIKRIFAFMLVVFSSSWPIISNGTMMTPKLSRMVAEVQAVNRFFIQPHFLLGNIFLVLEIILFLKYLETPKVKYVLFSVIIVFLTTFFRPSHVMLYLGTVGLYFFTRLPRRSPSLTWFAPRNDNNLVIVFTLVILLSSLPGFYYLWSLRQNLPYLPYFQYDFLANNLFDIIDWILLQGPILLLSVLGLVLYFKKSVNSKNLLLWSFVLVNFLSLFVFSKFFSLNPLRFLQTPLFAILAILATEAIFRFSKIIIVIIIIIVITVILSLPTLWLDFEHEVHLYVDAYYIWPPKGYLPVLKFLEKNSQPDDVVLTHHSLSNLVPMISGNSVYWGHINETLGYNQKQILVENFYKGIMTEIEASKFLTDNKIKFVLYGREERNLGKLEYKFLKPIYNNEDLEIFQ